MLWDDNWHLLRDTVQQYLKVVGLVELAWGWINFNWKLVYANLLKSNTEMKTIYTHPWKCTFMIRTVNWNGKWQSSYVAVPYRADVKSLLFSSVLILVPPKISTLKLSTLKMSTLRMSTLKCQLIIQPCASSFYSQYMKSVVSITTHCMCSVHMNSSHYPPPSPPSPLLLLFPFHLALTFLFLTPLPLLIASSLLHSY